LLKLKSSVSIPDIKRNQKKNKKRKRKKKDLRFLIRGVLQWWNEELELDPAKKFTGNMARKTFATMGLRYVA